MLGLTLLVTVLTAAIAGGLELNMQFKSLMPQSHPTVQEYDFIVNNYSSATNIIVAVKGDENSIKSFADDLVPKLRAMTEYVSRVDYKINREFMGRHGFMLSKARDLDNSRNLFSDLRLVPFLTRLNDSFEQTYIADDEGISNGEKEDKAVRALDGIENWLQTMTLYLDGDGDVEAAREAVDRMLIGDPYFISQDKDILLLFAQPTFTLNEVDKLMMAMNAIDSQIEELVSKYPNIDAGTTGLMALSRDEFNALSSDLYVTTLIAFILIIGLFIVSFRMWAAPLLAGISLIVGLIWASGFIAVTVGSLNMMTSMFAVILVGLGIDYNIHVISGYTEFRAEGHSIYDALRMALVKTGNGIVIGAVSTALAFLTMLISENQGMKEFAVVVGGGVLFTMIASLLVLPPLLVARDRIRVRRKGEPRSLRSISYGRVGNLAEWLAARPIQVLATLFVVTVLMAYSAFTISFDYNYLNLEPVGLKSIELQDEIIDEFDITPDILLVTAASVEEARSISDQAKELKSVGLVMSISDYVPSSEQHERRLPYIRKIRSDLANGTTLPAMTEDDVDLLLNELYRMEDNVIELAQLAFAGGQDKVDRKAERIVGDLEQTAAERSGLFRPLVERLDSDRSSGAARLAAFERDYEPFLRTAALGMTSEEIITLPDLPASIRNQFVSNDGRQFLLSIYPRQQVWDLEFLGRLTKQMHRIDPRVTGMPPIFFVLVEYIAKDGRRAALLTMVLVFLLLWIDFRSINSAVAAMLSLAVGAIWMVGLMNVFGMKFNLLNVIGIPLILGIGIDDAVHILNRYRVEGRGRINVVYASTGKAIILTSITTMLAFGSLTFATYRGLGSLGLTLAIGVGTALLTSLLMLPALLGLLEKYTRYGIQSTDRPRKKGAAIIAIVFLFPILMWSNTVRAQVPTVDVLDIIRRVDANERTESSRIIGKQIITTSSGRKRTLEIESYAKGGNEKSLIVYTGPARVRGDKILMLNDGDDIWFYTPKTDRVRHLASHARRQKVQGSDFSYEDLSTGKFEEDYTHTLLGQVEMDGVDYYKIEAIPDESGPSYSKIIVWVETTRYVVRRIDYYDDGALLKRLTNSDIRELEGHILPFKMLMENLRDGSRTEFEFSEMTLNIELEDQLFTTENLKRR
ncbi:MAG: hypothetical protein BMS9Abin05_0251 [Rhodothermia bacterium]|nr:MAG: hypothetical protein BMS9Abin05_0251 [Rhodothermia bacterium]